MRLLEQADALCRTMHGAESPRELFQALATGLHAHRLPDHFALASWSEEDGRLFVEFSNDGYASAGQSLCPPPELAEDPRSTGLHSDACEGAPERLWISLLVEDEPLGAIAFETADHAIGEDECSLLEFVAHRLALAWIDCQVFAETQQLYIADSAKLAALIETGEVLRAHDLEGVLATLMGVATSAVDGDVGCISLFDENREATHCVEWGLTTGQVGRILEDHPESIAQTLLIDREPIALMGIDLPNVAESSQDVRFDLLAIPLATAERTLGCLVVIRNAGEQQPLDLLQTIAALAANAVDNMLLQEAELEREALATQLRVAGEIQAGLVPETPPPMPGVELAGIQIQCDESGGDYYGFFPLADGRIAVCVADATGHGIGAALIITTARALLRAELERDQRPHEIIETMNRILEQDLADDKFTTLFFAFYDPKTRELEYASAGHHPAHVYRAEKGEFERLENTGPPLGMFAESLYGVAEPVHLNPGDIVLSMTDGIPEAMNEQEEQFGDERIEHVIRSLRGESPERMIEAIVAASTEFAVEQDDDITIVGLRATEPAA